MSQAFTTSRSLLGRHPYLASLNTSELKKQQISSMMTVRETGVCYREHKHEYERRSYDKPFKCDGCKEQGSGLRHRCDHCGHELHEECFSPKTEISHESFPGSSFRFFEKPQTKCAEQKCKECRRYCDACGKDIRGFNYHCEIKGWDLHPCCSNLRKKIYIDQTIFELQEGVSSRCIWCNQKKIACGEKKIPGWSYVSNCGMYHFHVYCVTKLLHGDADKDGNLTAEDINLHQLAKSHVKGRRKPVYWRMVALFLKAILSILVGDPTTMFSHLLVDLLTPS